MGNSNSVKICKDSNVPNVTMNNYVSEKYCCEECKMYYNFFQEKYCYNCKMNYNFFQRKHCRKCNTAYFTNDGRHCCQCKSRYGNRDYHCNIHCYVTVNSKTCKKCLIPHEPNEKLNYCDICFQSNVNCITLKCCKGKHICYICNKRSEKNCFFCRQSVVK